MTSRRRNVFIGGGSGGVGSAVCRAFARSGARVSFSYYRNIDGARALADELGPDAAAVQLDLSDAQATRAALDDAASRAGQLDSVVYAAGPTFDMGFVSQLDPARWAEVMATDVNGCFHLFHAALQIMQPQKRGSLVALSTCALRQPPKADVLSAAPKAAIDMLVKCIAKEEGRNGIRANTVELGFIDAGIAAHHIANVWTPELVAGIKARTPLQRFGTAEEVADAVVFLCSPAAGFITGQALGVDGGAAL